MTPSPTSPDPPLLQVSRLSKSFPVRRGLLGRPAARAIALVDVSLVIKPGETLGLVGESGCGKSTLGRTILALEEPTAGCVVFDRHLIVDRTSNNRRGALTSLNRKSLRHFRRQAQIVLQDPAGSLNPRMTVEQSVAEGLVVQRMGDRKSRREIVLRVLQQVGLDADCLHRYPHEFSGGQRQRICIARALAVGPRFLVLDEPVSSLDASVQAQIVNLLADLKLQHGLTYLFISHDLALVEHLADRVAVMYLGQIVETAPREELYRNALHPYTRALLAAMPRLEPDIAFAAPTSTPELPAGGVVALGDGARGGQSMRGCPFQPRCPLAMDICRHEAPQEQWLGDHSVRCHATNGAKAATGVV